MIVAVVGPYGGGGAVARIPSVMRSDEAWPAGHRAAASALTTAGFGPVAVAVVVAAKSPGREVQTLLSRIAIRWLPAGLASRPSRRAAQRERRQPAEAVRVREATLGGEPCPPAYRPAVLTRRKKGQSETEISASG